MELFDTTVSEVASIPEKVRDAGLVFRQPSPQTIRLILSGPADQRYVMQCVGVAHQFLSKPCESDALREFIKVRHGVNTPSSRKSFRCIVHPMNPP